MKTTKEKNIIFQPITQDNILTATEVVLSIFPNHCPYNSSLKAYKNNATYWLVYENNTLIGFSGLYTMPEFNQPYTVWLGFFGVIAKYRRQGYGKKILLETINIAQKKGCKFLRLYSSKRDDICPNAYNFYKKFCDMYDGIIEDYNLEAPQSQWIVVSLSISDEKVSKWDNKNLHLDKEEEKERIGMRNYLKHKNKIDIF